MKKNQKAAKAESVKPNELGIAVSQILKQYDAIAYGTPLPKPEEYGKCVDVVIEDSTRTAILLVIKLEASFLNLSSFVKKYPGLNGLGISGSDRTNLCEINQDGSFSICYDNFLPVNTPAKR